uniref:C3/C5 convertase n=1 Tax=Exaiptasia diaphana TaxID=2652724 RepID=A0A182C8W3_EXADI|nr:factor B2b protein [Exaiptasia diaphana]
MNMKEVFLVSIILLFWFVHPSESVQRRCKAPVRIENGVRASKRRFYRIGQALLYRCKAGHEKENKTTPFCNQTGKWSHMSWACKPISCGEPPAIPNGRYSASRLTYGSKATYTCNYGYKIVGRPYRICKKNGKWTKKPQCLKYRCRIKGKLRIRNGQVNVTDQTLSHDATLIFKCKPGYDLIGDDTTTCLEGRWSHTTPPYCRAKTCPNPGSPEGGYRLGYNFRIGGTVRFICGPGYKMRGSRSRTCMGNKTWSGNLTICDTGRSDCPVLGTPVSGYKIGNRYNFGSIVRFKCRRGYILTGSSHRLCTNKGTWNGTESKCVDIFDHLVTDVDQTAILLRKGLDTMLEYTCSGGNKTCNISGVDTRARKVSVDLTDSKGLDVLFIFDASSSITDSDFKLGVQFARRLVNVLNPTWKPKGTRIAAIVYATQAEVVFNFHEHAALSISGVHNMLRKLIKLRTNKNYRSLKNVSPKLQNDALFKGGTASAQALELAAAKVFVTRKSQRQRVLFFITDGMSNIGGSPIKKAKILRNRPDKGGFNVDIYAIGIGKKVADPSNNMYKELYDIASPGVDHVIIVESFKHLNNASKKAIEIKYDYRPCGEGFSFSDSRGRVAGGTASKQGKWPWQVGMYILSKSGMDKLELICGGALVERDWVLTAAHCLYEKQDNGLFRKMHPSGLTVIAGSNDLASRAFDENVKSTPAEKLINPDSYIHGNGFKNDIALIKLKEPFELGPFIRKICLPGKKNVDMPGKTGYVAGWGKTKIYKNGGEAKSLENSKVLMESRFEIQPPQICINSTSKRHRGDVDPKVVFCAGDGQGGNDTCSGDSGGSFMRLVEQEGKWKWVSVGLVSWGEGCGMKNKYGMYTKVWPFVDWIKKTIRDYK